MTGKLICISGPSAVGKDALITGLLARHPDWQIGNSYTTRAPRPQEGENSTYNFVSPEEFERLAEEGRMLEWKEVHGYWFGTDRESVRAALEQGHTVLHQLDVQGALELKAQLVAGARPRLLFLQYDPTVPLEELMRRRFKGDSRREAMAEEEFTRRLQDARHEQTLAYHFEKVVTNYEGDLTKTITEAEQWIENR